MIDPNVLSRCKLPSISREPARAVSCHLCHETEYGNLKSVTAGIPLFIATCLLVRKHDRRLPRHQQFEAHLAYGQILLSNVQLIDIDSHCTNSGRGKGARIEGLCSVYCLSIQSLAHSRHTGGGMKCCQQCGRLSSRLSICAQISSSKYLPNGGRRGARVRPQYGCQRKSYLRACTRSRTGRPRLEWRMRPPPRRP